jgi:hypothetical protein
MVESENEGEEGKSSKRRKSSKKGSSTASRLDFLALPAQEGEHDLRLKVRELLMSILYEQLERCDLLACNCKRYMQHLSVPRGCFALAPVSAPLHY